AVLIEQYAGGDAAKKLYPQWRGGYYFAAHPKGDSAAPLDLLYVSRWASADTAAQFAAIYAGELKERYRNIHPVTEHGTGNTSDAKAAAVTGTREWLTEDGD